MTCETQAQEGGKFRSKKHSTRFPNIVLATPCLYLISHVDFADFVCAGQARQCRTHRLHRLHPLQHKHRLRRIPLVQSTHSGVGEEVEAEAEAEDKLGGEGGGTIHEAEGDTRAPLGPFDQRATGSIKSISLWESVLRSGRKRTRTDSSRTIMGSTVTLPDVWIVHSRIPMTQQVLLRPTQCCQG